MIVDFGDFVAFARLFGKRATDPEFSDSFDLDNDGLVGFSDFIILAQAMGN